MRTRHLALTVAALVLAACGSDSTGPDVQPGPEPVGVVDDTGGSVETSDGAVKLTFPAGAVGANTEITVEEAKEVPEDPDLVPGTSYDFGPDGATFSEPVDIVLRYDPTLLPEGVDASSLALHKLIGDGWRSVGQSTVDPESHTVTATLTGFSVYALLSLGEAATVEAHAGDGQSGSVGRSVDVAPSVLVLNERGDPLPDVDVHFAVSAGGGSASDTAMVTGADGIASVGSWTLGPAGPQSLTATVEGLDPVVFSATAEAAAACGASVPYTLGETVAGTLGAPDCIDSALRYADYYTLEVDAPIEVALTMTAEGFDPVVGVFAEDGTQVVAQYASSRGFTRALLGAGTYRIGARRKDAEGSAIAPDAAAPYSLTVSETVHTAESCDIANTVFVTPGVVASGTMSTGHCTDTFSDDPEQRYAEYQIAMRAGSTYTMTLTADTTAAVSLWDADGQHEDIAGTSLPGTVQLTYTAVQDGFHGVPVIGHAGVGYALQIEVSEGAVDVCARSTPYVLGATNWGILAEQSCVDAQGRYAEYYELVVTEQLSVTLNMSSGDLAPYISAFDADGRLVVTQYTANPGFTRAVLAPGTYRLAARSVDAAAPGWYEVWLQEDAHAVDVCEPASNAFVTPGVLVTGYITEGDCLDELAAEPGLYWENYPMRLLAGETVTVTLSAPAHARLSVWNTVGENVAFQETDGSVSVSATITADAEGWYNFYAIAFPGTEYSLSFSERGTAGAAAPAQGTGPLAPAGMGAMK